MVVQREGKMKLNIVVYILKGNEWVEIIKIPVQGIPAEKEITDAIEQIHHVLLDSGDAELTTLNQFIAFRNLEKEFNVFKVIAEYEEL